MPSCSWSSPIFSSRTIRSSGRGNWPRCGLPASIGRSLAVVARRIDLGEHIRLGVGELQSGGRDKDSILADTMEAVIAAVYLDGGLEQARRMILGLWSDLIVGKAADPGWRDFKTRLQERLAADGKRPTYVVNGTGPDHARVFTAVVELDGRTLGEGVGRSKKEAEQAAARAALDGG